MLIARTRPALVGLFAAGVLLLLGSVAAAADEHGTGTLDRLEREATGSELHVTDVAVATYEGYDQVRFTIEGDGEPGWFIEYGAAAQQGSGEPIALDGEALRVALRFMEMRLDMPSRSVGGAGGAVNEVVDDSVFEGQHLFLVAVDGRLPYAADWDGEAGQVVVTVYHDADDVPVDGVEAGAGGTGHSHVGVLVLVTGLLVLTAAVALSVRRVRTS